MVILNATKSIKSIMSDLGTLISIKPGEFSEVFIASRNMIISAMRLGEPNEIGIVCSGSYELEIAKSITASVPYLYTDIAECKSKLLDPNIDYKESLKSKLDNQAYKEELSKKDELIKSLNNEISNLKKSLDEIKISNSSNDLISEINQLQSKYNLLMTEKTAIENNLKESEDEVTNLNIRLNELRNELGSKSQELTAINSSYSKLLDENKELKYQLDIANSNELNKSNDDLNKANEHISQLMSEKDGLIDEVNISKSKIEELTKETKDWEECCKRKDTEIEDLKTALTESADQIESMRTSFNQACEKFKITRDENGEWIQLTD